MMKIVHAHPGIGEPMTEEEMKNFLANDNNNNNLLVRIGFIDEKGEPNVIPTGYYFDSVSNKIYITTMKASKKVSNLRKNNVIAYCIDDPIPPFKGVRGKGIVKIHQDVSHNTPIAKKYMMKRVGSLDHPNAKWLLSEIEKGNELILEITPIYYSTWRSAIPT
jgi:general stress protein 26